MEQRITIKTEQTCSNNYQPELKKIIKLLLLKIILFYSILLFYSRIYSLKECGK